MHTGGAVPGFGVLSADLGAELSYGPPPAGSGAANLGLGGLSYGPPPVRGLNHLLGGGGGGTCGLGPIMGYGIPPPVMTAGAPSAV